VIVGVADSIAFATATTSPTAPERAARLSSLAEAHFAYVWRLLRRLGLSDSDADDAAQQAFLVASLRLQDIQPGSERSFLYKSAVHLAYKSRRTLQRRREEDLEAFTLEASSPGPDELVDRRRAREMLDAIVGTMPLELRVVFVLYEIDGLGTSEIAEVVGIPLGTVASRLRRARADFETRVARFEACRSPRGAKP
jgi:RNA polymerase sigma-70 factor (ECF subfamily)